MHSWLDRSKMWNVASLSIYDKPQGRMLHKDGSRQGWLVVEWEDRYCYWGRYWMYTRLMGYKKTGIVCVDDRPKMWIKSMHTWEPANPN